MANRPNLSPPPLKRNVWAWHTAKVTSLSADLLMKGERRFEGETYLSGGYGIRLALEAKPAGWTRLDTFARVWQPSRLKGIQVSPGYGTPFLAATQVFDLRPVPRKFLALSHTDSVTERIVAPGMILVTRSGSVGRATLAHKGHVDTIISDDLLRVEPRENRLWGWLYAYLRAPQVRAMMSSVQYGHIIKHLEVHHLNALPIPILRDELHEQFQTDVRSVLNLRSQSYELTKEAESELINYFPSLKSEQTGELGFFIEAKELDKRQRLEANCFVPSVRRIEAAFKKDAEEVVSLSAVTERIFVPGRFKHIYGNGGTPYLDSADLLEINPDIVKNVLSLTLSEQEEYRVKEGWLLTPCSGQTYGNIGHTVLATDWHTEKLLSNHALRICPNNQIRAGYLQCVIGHPQLGRQQMVRYAFGSSVPEIAPEDIANVHIPRLDPAVENKLADMIEKAAILRTQADALENEIAAQAEAILDRFLAGDTRDVITEDRL